MNLFRRPVLIALLWLAPLARLCAGDNCVLYWDQQALDTTRLSRNPPPISSLYFAAFHVAIFDAINGIDRTRQGWLVTDPAPAGANVDAAAAGAALAIFKGLWGLTTNPRNFQLAFDKAMAAIPDGPAKTDGVAWGKKVGAAVLAKLADTGYDKPIPGKYSSTHRARQMARNPRRLPSTPASFLGQSPALRFDFAVAVPGASPRIPWFQGVRRGDRLR